MSSSVSSPPRLISDELWALVEPLIPPPRPAVHGRTGRPRTSDRDVLEGIAFVLSTGIGWAKLPAELGYGWGWTCWRRMRGCPCAGNRRSSWYLTLTNEHTPSPDRGHAMCVYAAVCSVARLWVFSSVVGLLWPQVECRRRVL